MSWKRVGSICTPVLIVTLAGLATAAPATGPTGPGRIPEPANDDDFYSRQPAREELGRLLFFDKILSGNRNISCATCHHPLAATADGLSLSVGEGGSGLGTTRDTGAGANRIHERVPRNAPHVFNLGAREFRRMFHDGRVVADPTRPSGFRSPAGDLLPAGLDNVLAVQAMFPVTSGAEMAGQPGENPLADDAANGDLAGVWQRLAARLRAVDGYVDLFVGAFDDIRSADDITYVHAANAIAAFEADAWRFDDSPFDRWLRRDRDVLSPSARRGLQLFYGPAGCASCHAGTFQTDHEFHAIGVPQIGPGKGDNLAGFDDGLDDFGRERFTGRTADRFRFRTPTLRNVALTGPWGHDGAFYDLEAMVRHHLDPWNSLESYDPSQARLPSRADLDALDFVCFESAERRAALAAAIELEPVLLRDREVADLIEFLHALTDRRVFDLRNDLPESVPSGLPLAE